MKNALCHIGLMIAASVCSAGYVVDLQLPGGTTVVHVAVQSNGTANHPFDTTDDEGRGTGVEVGITNFVVSSSGVALSLYAGWRIPIAWQTFTNAGNIVRSPILDVSGISAALSNVNLNAWVPLGGISRPSGEPKSARIRIREVISTPDGALDHQPSGAAVRETNDIEKVQRGRE